MAYCKLGEYSDVYMLPFDDNKIVCLFCKLADEAFAEFDSIREAIRHLYAHRAAGHRVPEHAFEQLLKELRAELGLKE